MNKLTLVARYALLSCLSFCTNAQQLFAQPGYDQYDTLQIGGIRQVIHVKGARNAPVILFLHGGPGSSRMKDAEKFTSELQQKFTVVQWDQRETGRTLQLNHTNKPITLSLMERDTYELVNSLLKRFHKDKLYLAGESWGTVLGFYMAAKHPELLHAYLAFSPVVDQVKSEQMALAMVKNEAVQGGDLAAQHELGTVKIPFENVEQIYYLRKWLFVHDGTPLPDKDTTMIKAYMQSWTGTWMNTWNAAMQRNLFTTLPRVQCPVYFFLGGKDYQTNCTIAKRYYEQLIAPKKKLFWFANAGHSLLVTEAAQVQDTIINQVLQRR